ncbi:MAG TPA: serine/threonine-protein kinase [Nostocaceae cyanobacterium]|nr:serine/threonine-protein kinase [Nostocaceae cyanobacterium]
MNQEILAERYEIQAQLGKKAGRRTLLARDILTDELVIVKLLTLSSDFEWDDLKLFEREAKTLQSLSHPAIPSYLNYFEVNSPQYKGFALVQTYIPAQTLEQCFRSGRIFTEAEVKEIARRVLKILIYLHSLNPPVIHRDLKPSNILLGDRTGNSVGKIYLIDFGSVQTVLATQGGTKTVVGTYGYMPLEQFGDRAVPASDLYSLGATLIYLVTGTHPADLPQKDFRIQFAHLTHLSPDFTNWLKWMTEPSLDQRPSSAEAALKTLEHLHFSPDPTTLTHKKPLKSKIILKKNPEKIEIIRPFFDFEPLTLLMFFISCFGIGWNLLILVSKPMATTNWLLIFSLAAIFSGIFSSLFNFFTSHQLKIDKLYISSFISLFGFKVYSKSPSLRKTITKIVCKQEANKSLEIFSDIHKYQISHIPSQIELEWLSTELSDWLGGVQINKE